MKRKFKLKNESAFTLVEVLVSIVIISLIAIYIMPLLTQGIKSIYIASENTKNLFQNEGEMQYNIADKIVYNEVEVPVKFTNKDEIKKVKGGLVKSGDLYSYIAKIPTIKISPSVLEEGYRKENILIQGNNTNFSDESDLKIIDKNNNEVAYTIFNNYLVNSTNSIDLNLDRGLTNADSPYTLRIKTEVDNTGLEELEAEIVRTRLQVNPPLFAVVGEAGEMLVSADGKSWTNRSTPLIDNFKSIIRVNDRYILATENAEILSLIDNRGFYTKDLELETINELIIDNDDPPKIWVIGKTLSTNNYPIYYSENGGNWESFNKIDSSTDSNLKEFLTAEVSQDNREMIFAGESKIYLYEIDNDILKKIELENELEDEENEITTSDITIFDIAYGDENFVLIGKDTDDKRIILNYDNDENWNLIKEESGAKLNSINWSREYEKFFIAGNEGKLLSSDDGVNFVEESIETIVSTDVDLNTVNTYSVDNTPLLLIGGHSSLNGYLYYSDDENDYTNLKHSKGDKINTIIDFTGRY